MTNKGTPRTIGRYEILAPLGSGSQGSVWKARDPVLERLVALKLLKDAASELHSKADDGSPLEARASGRLKHPNIIPIFDAGTTDDGTWLVFEYVEGLPMAKRLEESGGTGVAGAIRLIAAILDALDHAHRSQVLHLDLSPRNILIDNDGTPRVMDFGLAQYVDFTSPAGDWVSGTLRYMSPEHFLRREIGPWTDVFALGSTFYEIVTGKQLYNGDSVRDIQVKIAMTDADLSGLRTLEHGEAFGRFLAGALVRDGKGRYGDAAVMHDAFRQFVADTGLSENSGGGRHSTVEFLLRRMQRRKDFPSISRTLSDINRLTGDGSDASADKLANVILRDFALTSKLLKLVNSAFYGARAVQVTSISQAVVFLGIEQVRMTANSLAFLGHMKGDSKALKDAMARSFLAGLMARHLAQRAGLKAAEEAFICGMCQNLGESLAIFYFPEDHADVVALQRERSLDKADAARGVLGVSYADLGAAVAASWNLPSAIVAAVRGLPAGTVAAPAGEAESLRDLAVFANELCDIAGSGDPETIPARIEALRTRFAASVSLEQAYCLQLLAAAFGKLEAYAPVFEISVEGSGYCRAVRGWLDSLADEAAAAAN